MSEFELENIDCNLCGSPTGRIRYSATEGWPSSAADHYAATTDKFGAYGTLKECADCGLVYTTPRLVPQAILGGYQETEDPNYTEESESRSINAYMSLAAIRRFAKHGRLLEVGCSVGYFLNAARHSFEVVGVEPSRWAQKYTRERLKIEVPAATLEEAAFSDAHFDVVAMIDVIEHLPDPLAALREVRRILKPGGHLYIVTPDIESLSARILGSRWWGLRPAHIFYFSSKTLRAMLEANGFEIVYRRSYGRIFSWGYWLSRLTNYPRFIYNTVAWVIRLFGVEDKFLYLDTRDTVQMVARAR
jgi:2-polyprenyl-3-methyl-5-hydroxy-6-metoxy-1,4-benzoquinol methylase